jgi:hypothetical protein
MQGLEAWEIALLAIAAYVAVLALVRLMRRYRDTLTENYEQQLHRGKKRPKAKKPTTTATTDNPTK